MQAHAQKIQPIVEGKNTPVFSIISQSLILIASGVMLFLFFMHRTKPEDQAWVQYTVMMVAFAIVGYCGTQFLMQQPLFPKPSELRPIDPNTIVRMAVIFGCAMVTQIITKTVFTFSTTEQAMYFVFAAVCEEVFFRVLILTALNKLSPSLFMKIIGIIVQAAMFTAIHQNYYNNLPMLLSVFIGGLILGIFYTIWRDPTSNILGHFLLNIVAVGSLFINL